MILKSAAVLIASGTASRESLPALNPTHTACKSAPGDDFTRTRFIILGAPEISYAAAGLSGPFSPKGSPGSLTEELKGDACYR